mgnify:CR=1 FL=1
MGIEQFFGSITGENVDYSPLVMKVESKDITNFYNNYASDNSPDASYIYFDFNSMVYDIGGDVESCFQNLLLIIIYKDAIDSVKASSTILSVKDKLGATLEELSLPDVDTLLKMTPENFRLTISYQIDDIVKLLCKKSVVNIIKATSTPSKLKKIMVAIDGVPTYAKIVTQLKRRYMGKISMRLQHLIKEDYLDGTLSGFSENRKIYENAKFSFNYSHVSSKGEFLDNLTIYFGEQMGNLFADDSTYVNITHANKEKQVICSGYDKQGEGEMKIVIDVKKDVSKNSSERIVFYSPDSDVIILCMLLMNHLNPSNVYMMRSNRQENNYALIDIKELSNKLYDYVNTKFNQRRMNDLSAYDNKRNLFIGKSDTGKNEFYDSDKDKIIEERGPTPPRRMVYGVPRDQGNKLSNFDLNVYSGVVDKIIGRYCDIKLDKKDADGNSYYVSVYCKDKESPVSSRVNVVYKKTFSNKYIFELQSELNMRGGYTLDKNSVINDLAMIFTLFGNDFVPKVLTINIKSYMGDFMHAYIKALISIHMEMGDSIVDKKMTITYFDKTNYKLSIENFTVFLKELIDVENKFIQINRILQERYSYKSLLHGVIKGTKRAEKVLASASLRHSDGADKYVNLKGPGKKLPREPNQVIAKVKAFIHLYMNYKESVNKFTSLIDNALTDNIVEYINKYYEAIIDNEKTKSMQLEHNEYSVYMENIYNKLDELSESVKTDGNNFVYSFRGNSNAQKYIELALENIKIIDFDSSLELFIQKLKNSFGKYSDTREELDLDKEKKFSCNLAVILLAKYAIDHKTIYKFMMPGGEDNRDIFDDKRFTDEIKDSVLPKEEYGEYDFTIFKSEKLEGEYGKLLNAKILNLCGFKVENDVLVECNKEDEIEYYYSKNMGLYGNGQIGELCKDYFDGLLWTFNYYFNDHYENKSSSWNYGYKMAPLIKNLYEEIKYMTNDTIDTRMAALASFDRVFSMYFTPLEHTAYIGHVNASTSHLSGDVGEYARMTKIVNDYINIKDTGNTLNIAQIVSKIKERSEDAAKSINCETAHYLNNCVIENLTSFIPEVDEYLNMIHKRNSSLSTMLT